MNTGSPEKPWYAPMLTAFIGSDCPRSVGISPSEFARDIHTFERRLAREGESFLTKTLPKLGKSIDLALQGHKPLSVTSFKKRRRSSALPAFLQGLLKRVFTDSGWVLDEPCLTSVRLLRQVCFWCKKIEKGYSDESLRVAVDELIAVDSDLPVQLTNADQRVLGFARVLIHGIFKDIDLRDMRPQHGPGSVAGREGVVGKRDLMNSYRELEKVFRPIPWFRSMRDAAENPQCVYGRPRFEFGLSRIEFVEKDSSGPRSIGLEPAEYMWCQQALKQRMYAHIENSRLTKGRVNFTDQRINRKLTGDLWYDTLDMSKASDRNSLALVRHLFEGTKIWPYMLASRSPGAVLPGGELLMFKKFAPMGSALCFPTMAVVFFAIAVGGLHIRCNVPLQIALHHVFVYGDDLIVPHGFFSALNDIFTSFSIKFNEDKCCTHGKFRESCGMDAFSGVDVTPVRLKKAYTEDATGLIPLVEHHNILMARGYHDAAVALKDSIWIHHKKYLKYLQMIPCSSVPNLQILHWEGYFQEEVRVQYKHSIPSVRGLTFIPKRVKAKPASEMRYLREVLSRGGVVGSSFKWVPNSVVRSLDARYAGRLKRGRQVVPYSKEPSDLQKRIERMAAYQA